MASILRAFTNSTRRMRLSSREHSTVAHIIPTESPIEEETLPHYKAAHYYPVRIGDVYHTRYEVAGKLGYGAYSTSWLCQDLQCATSSPVDPRRALTNHELRAKNYRVLKVVYEHLAEVDSSHPGQSFIRELYDSFDLQRLLLALDFLHAEAEVIHADLKPDNLMLSLEDSSMLADFATAESVNPSPRKFRRPTGGRNYGLPESGPFIQPHIYRAPESGHDPFRHLALMVALVGPPPTEFVRRSETTEQCFESRAPVPSVLLETLETRLTGEEKELFLAFIRSMLKWMPEERKTAKQLLEHPFLL
ncbi:kinase-like domain-containing protein [Aspergillus desertorum]